MIDAVNKVLGEEPTVQEDVLLNEAGAPIKEPTSTGMKVYGRSYGNSAKAKQDQTKSSVDDLKGPKTKELMQKDKEDYMKTKGKYDEAAKPDYLDFDKDGDKKEPMKSALAAKKKVAEELNKNEKEAMEKAASDRKIKQEIAADRIEQKQKNMMKKAVADKSVKEELKGDQHKIDANKNNKIDAHDFAILRGKKKIKEDMYFARKLIEGMKRSDIPASVRKARGDAPLTPAEVKSGSKDSISDPKNLAKARNEEVEQIDEKNVPTSPEKWARAKAAAKSKFAVYPSAYANGWASKKYKAMGGGWKTANEEVEELDELDKSTLGSYIKKASKDIEKHTIATRDYGDKAGKSKKYSDFVDNAAASVKSTQKVDKRKDNIGKAVNRLTKEEIELTEEQLDEMINEVLGKDATAGDYIHDFIHSDNPKFAGKSKAERKKMALGAYYGAQKEAYEGSDDAITTDTLAGRMPGGRSNSFKSFKTRVNPLDKEGNGNPQKVPLQEPDETPSSSSIKAKPVGAIERTDNLDPKYGKPNTFKEAVVPFDGPYTKVKANIKDKSGAVHSPMSRARNLAQQAFKKVQDKTKIKSEMMLGKAGGTSESKKCK